MSKEFALLQQLRKPTKKIVNYYSDSPFTAQSVGISNLSANSAVKRVLSGALTADILSTVLDITGSAGEVSWVHIATADITSRVIRIKVTIDGVVAFDSTSSVINSASYGCYVVGGGSDSTSYISSNEIPVYFNNSFKIEVSSSLTETNKLYVGYRYNLR